MSERALIFGITGQDGSYLAEILLAKGYEVHGVYRRTSTGNLKNIEHILADVTLHRGDLGDSGSIQRVIERVAPQEIYNEADQDNVGWSHDLPHYSVQVTYGAVAVMLETIKGTATRFFQPASSTMFGGAPHPQNEQTPFDPQSPYACAKTAAYYLVRHYRAAHNVFASTAILYNHDSPRRTEDYLLHKICHSAVRVSENEQDAILLGNLDMRVDIGYAKEYMETAQTIMQQNKPDDFVIATGVGYKIQNLAEMALTCLGVSPEGKVKVNPDYDQRLLPAKGSPSVIGDITKAKECFGFSPEYHGNKLIEVLLGV